MPKEIIYDHIETKIRPQWPVSLLAPQRSLPHRFLHIHPEGLSDQDQPLDHRLQIHAELLIYDPLFPYSNKTLLRELIVIDFTILIIAKFFVEINSNPKLID